MIAFAKRCKISDQPDNQIISLMDTIETLRDVQVETPRLKHQARCLEMILWRRIGVLL